MFTVLKWNPETNSSVGDFEKKLRVYADSELIKMGPQLVSIPLHMRGVLSSAIHYKYVRDNMTKIMSDMMDHVVIAMVRPFQQLYKAFMDYVDAYSMCVGTYHTIFSFHKNTLINMLDDPRGATQLFQNMMSILSTLPDMIEKSTALKEAMVSFSEAVASIAGNTNTEGIVQTILKAKKEIAELQRAYDTLDLASIEFKATIKHLENTEGPTKTLKEALEKRLKAEEQSLEKATQQLQEARDEHGKRIEGKPRSFFSSIMFNAITDTKPLQKLLQDKCDTITKSIERLRHRIETADVDRTFQLTDANEKLSSLEQKKKPISEKLTQQSQYLTKLEAELMEARLVTSGCSRLQSTNITSTLKVIVPLFTRVAETSAAVSCFYKVTGKLFEDGRNVPFTAVLSFVEQMLQLSMIGDYLSNGTLFICDDPSVKSIVSKKDHVTKLLVQRVEAQPSSTFQQLQRVNNLVEHKEVSMEDLADLEL